MKTEFLRFAAALGAAAALLTSTPAFAQSANDLRPAGPPPAVTVPDTMSPSATAGPTIWLTDSYGQLSTITLGTYKIHRIGYEGTVLTDLSFDPVNGALYGVSFTSFYRINPATGQATFIGNLGISDANALVFDTTGKAYVAGSGDTNLWSLNIKTGRVSLIHSMSPFMSAGSLSFYNGTLVLAGYTGSSDSETPDTLVQLDPVHGWPVAYVHVPVALLYGIVSPGKNLLYGFANTSVYQLIPSETTYNKRAVLLNDFSGKGLGDIYGSAYDGNFQK